MKLSVIVFILFAVSVYSQPCTNVNSLMKVRNTRIGNYEYVIFEFKRPTSFSYSGAAVSAPFTHMASGDPVSVTGCQYRKIVFNDIFWMCETEEYFTLTTSREIKDIKTTGKLEGVCEYIVGYDCSMTYLSTYNYNVPDRKYVVMRFLR